LQITRRKKTQKKSCVRSPALTVRAITLKAQAGVCEFDAKSPFDLNLQLFNPRRFEFDHAATGHAGKVIVFGRRPRLKLLAAMVVREIARLDQPCRLEQVQSSIHGGKIDTRLSLLSAPVEFLCVEMARALLNELQEQSALSGDALALSAQQPVRLSFRQRLGWPQRPGFGFIANHLHLDFASARFKFGSDSVKRLSFLSPAK
jgi:hypothetical protein